MPMLNAERISCSGPKLSDAQTRNFEALKHTVMESAEADALAHLDFPAGHRRRARSWIIALAGIDWMEEAA